ncbi:WD40 repeat-like protein [Tilletiaria anomala UBC 951]|uniref:WD40 repeat-like protein n=1 Tax=Tilletiaria anomala (strain ATCC 24038 / CBS 436.72 / UBC 951) TaxID=1037660 RepID=A0A066WMB0_TILAU|nr:WD40 repeat-like protein [Tilletiaria anomala UBC 951]KDN52139.1 WD40 repeat-like protein [Tilletiaria anomala UBC 951]
MQSVKMQRARNAAAAVAARVWSGSSPLTKSHDLHDDALRSGVLNVTSHEAAVLPKNHGDAAAESMGQDSAFLVSSPNTRVADESETSEVMIDFLNELPPELAFSVLLHLKSPSEILNVSLVCKSWYVMATDNIIWKAAFEAQESWTLRSDANELLEKRALDPSSKPFPYYMDETSRGRRAGWAARPSLQAWRTDDASSDSDRLLGDHEPASEYTVFLDGLGDDSADVTYDYFVRNERYDTSNPSTPAGVRRAAQRGLATPSTVALTSSPVRIPAARKQHLARLDWRKLYAARLVLDQRWQGKSPSNDGKPFLPPYTYLIGHEDAIYCVANDEAEDSGTNGRIVTGSRDHTIKIWSCDTKSCIRTWRGHSGSVLCIRLENDRLYTGSSDGLMIVWDYSQLVAPLSDDRDPQIAETKDLPIVSRVSHPWSVLDIDFNEKHLITCCRDGCVRVWNKKDFSCILCYSPHCSPVNSGRLCGDRIVTIAGNNSVHLWDVTTGDTIRAFQTEHGPACVLFVEGLIIVGTKDPLMYAWDVETGELQHSWQGHEELVRALAYDSRRKLIASAGYDGRVKLWRSDSEQPVLTLQRHQDQVLDVALGVSRIITVGKERSVCVRNFGHGLDTTLFA